ncbi:MAG: hypothetical protein M1835_007921 [Candelina submexicana]|nr:MAG: hypothetical protein M1835_007921 [Candelina submexicana]
MAALHEALQILSPTDFSSVPLSDLKPYLQEVFSKSQLLIDSVPIPPSDGTLTPTARSRSSTATSSNASDISEVLASPARPETPVPTVAALQKEWGKPIKLAAKDNPLGMSVYRCSGKDGRGAWFARRSVHEGLGFSRWKRSLEREFPETMEFQGGPGEGNIRGIGGERRLERTVAEGVGKLEVYHLSAQFPGPTTPRDFVTLLLTSANALSDSSSATANPSQPKPASAPFTSHPRHYMVVSRPCNHPACPPREGFIRGQYESVEFIREIPTQPKKSSSTTNPDGTGRQTQLGKEAAIRNAKKSHTFPSHEDGSKSDEEPQHAEQSSTTRKRGSTISFAESRGRGAKGEKFDSHNEDGVDDELNPVEWIMITRSDPGGSVPRWIVERGTPSGIVADASKFLDWACKKEHLDSDEGGEAIAHKPTNDEKEEENSREHQTNGHLTGVSDEAKGELRDVPSEPQLSSAASESGGLLSNVTGMVSSGISTYAPAVVANNIPESLLSQHQQQQPAKVLDGDPSRDASLISNEKVAEKSKDRNDDEDDSLSIASDSSSVGSFVSADDYLDSKSTKSTTSQTASFSTKNSASLSPHGKELAKLNERKKKLDEQLTKAREKGVKDKQTLTAKEEAQLKRAEEKHGKEVSKYEERYHKEIARLEAKKEKETKKAEERRRKAEDRDEKTRYNKEIADTKAQIDLLTREREILRTQVGDLQKENTALVARLGKAGADRKDLLKEVRDEAGTSGGTIAGRTSRSSSLKSRDGKKDTNGVL